MSYLPTNVANGLLKLDSSGKAPVAQLPALTHSQNVAIPTVGTATTVGGSFGRFVGFVVGFTPNVSQAQYCTVQVETGVGTGVFTNERRVGLNTAAGNAQGQTTIGIFFFCPTGRQWKWAQTGTASPDSTSNITNTEW